MRTTPAGVALLVTALVAPGCGKENSTEAPQVFRVAHQLLTVSDSTPADMLLVIDDSLNMKPFQGALVTELAVLRDLLRALPATCRPWRLGVLTTSGDGALSTRLGTLSWQDDAPSVTLRDEPACRVIGPDNLDCLYRPDNASGLGLPGFSGGAYPRGLYALERFLDGTEAAEFLRPEASLLVVMISASEDCGAPGEVAEDLPGMDSRICSYAAKGVGPDGASSHPSDPQHRPYALAPVARLVQKLQMQKQDRAGLVKVLVVTGVADAAHPEQAAIEYLGSDPGAPVRPACALAGCAAGACDAAPGTRLLELARSFSPDGFTSSICRPEEFGGGIQPLRSFVSFPEFIALSRPVLDPALIALLANDIPLPRRSCADREDIRSCGEPGDPACDCVETVVYQPPDNPPEPEAPHGRLVFTVRLLERLLCSRSPGESLRCDFVFATP